MTVIITRAFIAQCVALLACAIILAGQRSSLDNFQSGAQILIDWLMKDN